MRRMTFLGLGLLLTLSLVTGSAVFAQEGDNGSNPNVFTIGEQTYTSFYPEGMTFTIEATSEAAPIVRATVFYDFGTEFIARDQTETIDNDAGLIEATLFRHETGGLIPWLEVNYYWRLVDAEGNAIETEPQTAIYEDPTPGREWLLAENDLVRVYWFGLPEWVGEEALDAVDEAAERWAQGFPDVELESRPLVVIYPDLESFLEWRGETGAESIRFVGTLRREWNGVVQRIPDQERLDRECGGLDAEEDFEHIVRVVARSTVTHELTHFHQYEIGVARGPDWWVEGQATFFEDPYQPYSGEARIANLVAMGELPTLTAGNTLSGAGTLAVDGCTHLAYDVGAAFMQFVRDNYGGYEAHGEIVRLIAQNQTVYHAFEIVTGRSFIELEQEWRASLGAGPPPTLAPTPTFAMPAFNLPTPPGG